MLQAPETLLSRKADSLSDVWSYGCLIHECWSQGQLPYPDQTDEVVVQRLALLATNRDHQQAMAPPKRCVGRGG